MKKLVPDYIEQLPVYPPGKPIEEVQREYGIKDEIIKLGSNENNLGPSPKALQAIKKSLQNMYRYPDNGGYYLKEKLSKKAGVKPSQILLGHGSNEIIQMIVLAFLQPGDEAITSEQTFILYPIMSSARGATVIEVSLKDFTYDLEAIAQRITHNTKLIFISNPNNPTGTIVHDEAFKRFMKAVPEDVIVVVDEAYREYVTSNEFPDALDYLRQGRNIIILRTFSKVYGLAGLRIGYGFTRTALTNYLERVRVPFNTSYLAQIGALAALDDDEHIKNSQHNNMRGLTFVYRELKILGLSYIATQTNFLLIRLGDRAEDIYRSLLQEGVIVRSMTSYGLKEYVRLTIGLPEENKRFVRCLKKLLHQAAPNKDATHPS